MAHTITTRDLNESDYNQYLTEWWKDWDWDPIPKDFLPENGLGGLMVEVDGEPACSGFIYKTNSKAAWVDWIISSKTPMNSDVRDLTIKTLIAELTKKAKLSGAAYVYALLKHNGLIKKYESLGYIKGDAYNHEMIKVL
jgi:hypothetical protein